MAPGPLATALQGHDMFLYFGHGSGDQYLSARYRATDRVVFIINCIFFTPVSCSQSSTVQKEQPNCFVFFSGSRQCAFALILPTISPLIQIACQARNAQLQSHTFSVSSNERNVETSRHVCGRALRRMPRCASALLMGCSSGSLAKAGQYEPSGPVLAYLMAGAHTSKSITQVCMFGRLSALLLTLQ
jgi:hypothetical protein